MNNEDYITIDIPNLTPEKIKQINLHANISIDDLSDIIVSQLTFMIDRLEKNSIRSPTERSNLDVDIVFIKRFFEKIEKELLKDGN